MAAATSNWKTTYTYLPDQVEIIKKLIGEGAIITVYDPVATLKAKEIFKEKINYVNSPKECINNSDCCILVTEWEEFRNLTPEFYFKHNAYIAAVNRASGVVQHYQGTPSVPGALAIMVKSDRELNLAKNANEALQVLQRNFPNSKELHSVE